MSVSSRFLFLFAILFLLAKQATAAPVVSVSQDANGITLKLNPGVLRLQIWSDRTIRVSRTDGDGLPADHSFAVIGQPRNVKWNYAETANDEIITTSLVQARVSRRTGAVTFRDSAGKVILAETDDARGSFKIRDEEGIYGLGQHQVGLMNYRGSVVHLQQVNMDVAVPMVISSAGYGLLWDNPSITDVTVSTPAALNRLTFSSEVEPDVDYYFFAGPEPDDVIAAYRQLTGSVPMMGRWAWGFWQCKEHYNSQKELLDVVTRYRAMHVPIDGIIQDWHYWPNAQWGSHDFDPARYPNPREMVDQLHAKNCHVLISVWPRFDLTTDNLKTLDQAGALYREINLTYPGVNGKWYDPFNPTARQLYWGLIAKKLLPFGLDGWWLDASEPELGVHWGEYRNYQTAAGPGSTVYNAYPLMHTTAVYQGQRKDAPDKRVFILTRSAYAGQQRNSAVTWSGDIRGTWDVFRRQIPAGLNFSASGIPYWNTDIGGFFGGHATDPNYVELFTRWFQFGAFCPMFRVHGTSDSKEMWKFDDATEKILISYDELRYRLLPYIYSVSWRVTNEGYSMMRPLVMDFRHDPLALNVPDEYMFGPDLLVCPVTQARAAARSVYLPAGREWYDFRTGEKHEGGQAIIAAAPIDTMPIFVPSGSILPWGPAVQYAGEQPEGPTTIKVFPGRSGTFTLYNDEGDNYDYEKGAYATIPILWDEDLRTLTIGKREGEYPGMNKQREFTVTLVGSNFEQIVNYDGSEVTVKVP